MKAIRSDVLNCKTQYKGKVRTAWNLRSKTTHNFEFNQCHLEHKISVLSSGQDRIGSTALLVSRVLENDDLRVAACKFLRGNYFTRRHLRCLIRESLRSWNRSEISQISANSETNKNLTSAISRTEWERNVVYRGGGGMRFSSFLPVNKNILKGSGRKASHFLFSSLSVIAVALRLICPPPPATRRPRNDLNSFFTLELFLSHPFSSVMFLRVRGWAE